MTRKIISGGQTGVDRAALDVALELGLPCGGWCPRGRLAEDGVIPAHYPLAETASASYLPRTRINARFSDATLILSPAPLTGGTRRTVEEAALMGKPVLVIDVVGGYSMNAVMVREWLTLCRVATLNVAGPRDSKHPGIYAMTRLFLLEVFGQG